jgi:WD40 repeat protein
VVETATRPEELAAHSRSIEGLAVDPAGKLFVTAVNNGTLTWWNVKSLERVRASLALAGEHALAVAFSRDGRWLAASHLDADGEGAVRLIRRSGDLWQPLDSPSRTVTAAGRSMISVARHPAGSLLALGGEDGTVELWDLKHRRVTTHASPHTDWVESLLFLDGERLVSAGGDHLVYLHTLPKTEAGSLSSRRLPMHAQSLSANDLWLAGLDKRDQDADVVHLLPVPPASRERPIDMRLNRGWLAMALALHPRRSALALGGDGMRWLWREAGRWWSRPLSGPEDLVLNLAFSPDGRWLAAAGARDNRGWVWLRPVGDRGPGAPIELESADGQLITVAFRRDSQALAAAGNDGRIYVWDLADRSQPIVLYGHTGQIYDLAFSFDGRHLVSAALDQQVIDWTLGTPILSDAVCRLVSGNLGWDDWQQRVGADMPYERTCRGLPVHPSLLAAADAQARRGDSKPARALYARINALDSTSALRPRERASALAALGQLEGTIRQGDLSGALDLLQVAQAAGQADLINADDWSRVCSAGLLRGDMRVLEACDQAVRLADYHSGLRLERGIARALAGQWQEAKSDIQQVLAENFFNQSEYQDVDTSAWIPALSAGKNPFSPALVKRLVASQP